MKQLAILQSRRFSRETQALVNTILECLLALAAKVEDNSPRELEQGFEFPWGHQTFLAKASYAYLSALYDHRHCPSAVRAGEWAAVVHLGWLQWDAFAAA